MLKLSKLDKLKSYKAPGAFAKTRRLLRVDMQRLNEMSPQPVKLGFLRKLSLCFRPEICALILYRLANYFYQRDNATMAQIFYRLNLFVTGADISPRSEIGPGCLVVHTIGLVIDGKLGDHATIFGHSVVQANYENGQWSKTPVLGNRCTLGVQSTVLGDVQVADDVTISAFTLLTQSVAENGSTVSADHLKKFKIYNKKR